MEKHILVKNNYLIYSLFLGESIHIVGEIMHIAIEGIDGVGKSTAARNLADKLGYTLVEKPLKYLFDEEGSESRYIEIRDHINAQPNKILSSWFYGLGNIFLYEKFANQDIVTDRHILSNYSWSGSEESEHVFDAIYSSVGAPDYTFVVYASPEELKKRLISRDINDPDLKKIKHIPEVYSKMEKILEKHKMRYKKIDSSDLQESDVLKIIMHTLRDEGIIPKNGK